MTDLGVAVPADHVGVVENDLAAHRLGESPDLFGCGGALPRRQPVMVPELRRSLRQAMHGPGEDDGKQDMFLDAYPRPTSPSRDAHQAVPAHAMAQPRA